MANSSDRLRAMWAEDLTKVGDLYATLKDIFTFAVHSQASAKINDVTGALLAFVAAETEKTDTTEEVIKGLVSKVKDAMVITRTSGVDLRLAEEILGKETMPPEVVTECHAVLTGPREAIVTLGCIVSIVIDEPKQEMGR